MNHYQTDRAQMLDISWNNKKRKKKKKIVVVKFLRMQFSMHFSMQYADNHKTLF